MSEPAPGIALTGKTFGKAIPILRVRNVAESIRYYVEHLGFHLEWQTEIIASVARDQCNVFLSQGDQGHAGSWIWLGVPDAVAVFRELSAKGAIIRQGPTNFVWAQEIQVQDPDGNVLRLGSEPTEEPFGPWLDMEGRLWHWNTEQQQWMLQQPA